MNLTTVNTTAVMLSEAALSMALESGVSNVSRHRWLRAINTFNAKYTLPVIVLCGIVGNLLALAVFICSPLRRLTISVYLAALSLTDFVFLIFLGLGWLENLQINIFALNGLCQTMVYLTFVVSFLSLWLIVTFTAELYCSIHCTYIHKKISRPKRAVIVVLVLVVVSACIYLFSFWRTRIVRVSESKLSCQFSGSNSMAIAVSIIDSFLTLVFPFSLLIYMNIRILYTVACVSNQKFKKGKMSSNPESRHWDTESGNILAKLHKMATKGRRSFYKNSSQNMNSKDSANLSIEKNKSGSDKGEKKHIRKISLNVSEGEIKINNGKGKMISVAKLIVENDGLGITVERCDSRKRNSIDVDNVMSGHRIRVGSSASQRVRKPSPIVIESEQREGGIILRARAYSDSQTKRSGNGNIRARNNTDAHVNSSSINNRARQHDRLSWRQAGDKRKDSIIVLEPFLPTVKIREQDKRGENRRRASSAQSEGKRPTRSRSRTVTAKSMERPKQNSLTKLQKKCFRMVVAIALVFLVLNLPSHAIRLQGLLRSLFDPNYRTSELEFELQQLVQTIYYLNFMVNVITYSACAKSFRMAFLQLPWHAFDFIKQSFRSCFPKRRMSKWAREQQKRERGEHSRLVEICIPELHLSEIPSFAPDYKPISPPCLLQLDSRSTSKEKSSENSQIIAVAS